MGSVKNKQQLILTVERDLRGRASAILLDQMVRIISNAGDDPQELEEALQKVRTGVKLFVDEQLSDQLYQDLRSSL